MRKVIVAIIAITLTSCAMFSSPRTTLGTLQDAAVAARQTLRPVIDSICANEKARCGDALECPGFDMCHNVRMIIIQTLEAVQFAIADANIALAMGNEERFEEAVKRVEELLEQVQYQMEVLGIIPPAEVEDGEEA